jgi:hypothetical protein
VPKGARRRIRDVRRRPVEDFRFVAGADRSSSTNRRLEVTGLLFDLRIERAGEVLGQQDGLHPCGAFRRRSGRRPTLHMFVDSKAPWWEIDDELPKFKEYPT